MRSDSKNEVLQACERDAKAKLQDLQRRQDSEALEQAMVTWEATGALFFTEWQAAAEITPTVADKVSAMIPKMVDKLVTSYVAGESLDRKLLSLTQDVNETRLAEN